MRIIGGRYRGRKFHPPKKIPTRPTTDFAKEGLFNVLSNYFNFENVAFLDLFAGTGSLSFEFASRGCKDVTSVERFPACSRFILQTARNLDYENVIRPKMMDVFKFLEQNKAKYDIIFAGPPYALERLPDLPDLIFKKQALEKEGWFILEHNPNHRFEEHPHFLALRKYGGTLFSIFGYKE